MTVARWQQPDYTTMQAAAYKAALDAAHAVAKRFADRFAPHQVYAGSPNPDMAVELDAGAIWNAETLTEVAAQTVSGFTVPSAGQHRIDRVVIDASTGVASRIAGTAATGSPSATPPAITTGKLPVCQVLITSADTYITNSMITDERAVIAGFVAATQAQMEAGSSLLVPVTPGRQHYHVSAPKAWALETQSGGSYANPAGYNITSIAKTGTGALTVTIGTDFSGTDTYAPVVGCIEAGATARANRGTLAAGAFDVRVSLDSDGSDLDAGFAFACLGDQA